MVEQGLVKLVQQGLTSLSPSVPGGFKVQLPKDLIGPSTPKAWTYHSVLSDPTYALNGQDGLTSWTVRIDCHGNSPADAIDLARAIDNVLRGGWSGTLPDTDNTVVQGIFRQGFFVDGFSDVNRTYVRTLEYLVNYQQI